MITYRVPGICQGARLVRRDRRLSPMPMEYKGKFPFFPYEKIRTYPIKMRRNKVE